MIVELDDSVGRLFLKLQSAGIWNNTLLAVVTDNGGMVRFRIDRDGQPLFPASAGNNWPLRGSKATLFEGGVRGTAFVSGGAVPAQVCAAKALGLIVT